MTKGYTIPITGHNFQFYTTDVTSYDWDDNKKIYVPVTRSGGDIPDGLVTYGNVSETNGVYSVDQTIHLDPNHIVDSLDFDLYDNSSYAAP